MLLTILRFADEDMLKESGNAVYHRMKRELDEIRCTTTVLLSLEVLIYFYASTVSTTSDNVDEKPHAGSLPLHLIPILGVRYKAEGHWLVYRVKPPVR
jgi:hypothetical protein